MSNKTSIETNEDFGSTASYKNYLIGFILSIVLTLIPFYLVAVERIIEGKLLITLLVGFAISQLIVQLVYFLHLNNEPNPRWKLQMFLFMALVLIILVIGTLWIMYSLNYNMMSPEKLDQHLIEKEGIYR